MEIYKSQELSQDLIMQVSSITEPTFVPMQTAVPLESLPHQMEVSTDDHPHFLGAAYPKKTSRVGSTFQAVISDTPDNMKQDRRLSEHIGKHHPQCLYKASDCIWDPSRLDPDGIKEYLSFVQKLFVKNALEGQFCESRALFFLKQENYDIEAAMQKLTMTTAALRERESKSYTAAVADDCSIDSNGMEEYQSNSVSDSDAEDSVEFSPKKKSRRYYKTNEERKKYTKHKVPDDLPIVRIFISLTTSNNSFEGVLMSVFCVVSLMILFHARSKGVFLGTTRNVFHGIRWIPSVLHILVQWKIVPQSIRWFSVSDVERAIAETTDRLWLSLTCCAWTVKQTFSVISRGFLDFSNVYIVDLIHPS